MDFIVGDHERRARAQKKVFLFSAEYKRPKPKDRDVSYIRFFFFATDFFFSSSLLRMLLKTVFVAYLVLQMMTQVSYF